MGRLSLWVLLGLTMFALSLHDVQVSAEVGPTESECRPYIEKAINELKTGDTTDSAETGENSKEQDASAEDTGGGGEDVASGEKGDETESGEQGDDDGDTTAEESVIVETVEESEEDDKEKEVEDQSGEEQKPGNGDQDDDDDDDGDEKKGDSDNDDDDDDKKSDEADNDNKSGEDDGEDTTADDGKSEEEGDDKEASKEGEDADDDDDDEVKTAEGDSKEDDGTDEDTDTKEESGEADDDKDDHDDEKADESVEAEKSDEGDDDKDDAVDSQEDKNGEDKDDDDDDGGKDDDDTEEEKDQAEAKSRGKRSIEEDDGDDDDRARSDSKEETAEDNDDDDDDDDKKNEGDSKEDDTKEDEKDDDDDDDTEEKDKDGDDDEDEDEEESRPEDDLLLETEIPENLRDRKHIDELLHLDDEYEDKEKAVDRVAEIILRDLKRIYENAIKPLETLYKYRDLSNRHFGDPEIFSKPLILFMGPWSGGKSTIINYLTENEYTANSLTSGAEPSPAYFNIVMYGNETEVLDGTQLAADWTFSGLQKFGQGLEDRLRGLKLPNKLLEKVNIVEIPGILEVRKQVSRLFPFNDACQWFIDRADVIFLVYDPAKLDVGPETEAILDQLKGREYQTRIILNKADTVKPEELLRVQSALIWNISPLMSSAQPPAMYTTSLWSHPYETTAPVRLLQAQERAFLRDIRSAVDKRIENKISSARRFAVRVRNHAKMVDCYLTTYYNHKTLFGNKKRISDEIIENPQNYHIYEGLSTLTNISRYDLPDPEVYRDFFRLNPLYEFKKLSETCTYFRGCPINKLDVAIAYDFPELVGKYKKMAESALANLESEPEPEQDDKSKS